ncbi:unnamed protein product [Bursaphelenchus okinawaensis]|uniref:Uncharacterized protein n=1 Tax=Bursaphelenchus okinawaensis TaxID=465554 RepID=A0A811KST7_9BILA|nr:unnamed protein product [Bursaphelenchus okinawaensis]CAG9110817.1 unnamed protein product [Bursaphelenchus okinawaensis]
MKLLRSELIRQRPLRARVPILHVLLMNSNSLSMGYYAEVASRHLVTLLQRILRNRAQHGVFARAGGRGDGTGGTHTRSRCFLLENNMSVEQILKQLRERPLYSWVQQVVIIIT